MEPFWLVLCQLLEDARRYLGEPVEEAVISVSAYFNDDQRCATKLSAQLAGLTAKWPYGELRSRLVREETE